MDAKPPRRSVPSRSRCSSSAAIHIGISGWTYAPWRGTFFPPGLPRRDELAYAADRFSSIEINGTFYSLQRPSSYKSWHARVPAHNFLFSVKAPRYITHIRRLADCAIPLANFFASGILCLAEKLGPILWQLPPSLKYDAERLETFLSLLPPDTESARALARRHDANVKQTWLKKTKPQRLYHALEVRHHSFCNPGFIALLRRHRVALVVADTAGKWPLMEDVTADFVYVRLHGDVELYASGYTNSALRGWARKIRAWHEGRTPRPARLNGAPDKKTRAREVFVYFDNDVKTRAPYDAMTLAHQLKLGPKPSPPPSADAIAEAPRLSWPGYPNAPRRKKIRPRKPAARLRS